VPAKDAVFGSFSLPKGLEHLAHLSRKFSKSKLLIKLAFLLRKPVLRYVANGAVDVRVDNVSYRLWPSVNLSDKRLLTTPYLLDGEERNYFVMHLPLGALLVDVGANIGGYSLQLAGARQDMNFICLEPDPRVAERLLRNISFNKWQDRVLVKPIGAGREKAEMQLNLNPDNQGQNSLIENNNTGHQKITVQIDTLKSILSEVELEMPWALKLDIEGAEYLALEGFFENCTYREHWPTWVQVEQYKNAKLNKAIDYLFKLGYKKVFEGRMNWILIKD